MLSRYFFKFPLFCDLSDGTLGLQVLGRNTIEVKHHVTSRHITSCQEDILSTRFITVDVDLDYLAKLVLFSFYTVELLFFSTHFPYCNNGKEVTAQLTFE